MHAISKTGPLAAGTPVFITTPIFYPNDLPHVGTIYPVLAADILARWHRACECKVLFLTGTDEHGKKIESAAQSKGMAPRQLVDQLSAKFKLAFNELGITYDRFIRTTDSDHLKVVREMLWRIHANGDIYPGVYEGPYCQDCEAYYTADELVDGKCPIHGKPVITLKEDCYFFKLSKYRDWLLQTYSENPEFVQPVARMKEVVSFVTRELVDLCISRSTFTWGIPLPFDERQVAYVWFDALINYITGCGYLLKPRRFDAFWPGTMHIIGKDILRFHAVLWPAMLKSAGLPPPRKIFAHGFWTVNGQKFSKSLGNAVHPSHLVAKYGLDPLRYYLFRAFPFGADGDLSEIDLVQRNNSELAEGLGNLVQRTVSMIVSYCDGWVPDALTQTELEDTIAKDLSAIVPQVSEAILNLQFKRALDSIWKAVRRLNVYANARSPWALHSRGDLESRNTVLAHLAEGLRIVAVLLSPFIPDSAALIAGRLGLTAVPGAASLHWGDSLRGKLAQMGPPLFRRLEGPGEQQKRESHQG